MWRDGSQRRRFWWLVGVLGILALGNGWGQDQAIPKVTFLEPQEDAVIPADAETVTIRFRLTSPDGTNLMRYQPFVNGHPGNDPIPIEPPSPEVELALVWRGVRQFPDGVYTITIRVVDAKGREGSGSLRLIKGQVSRPAKVDIVSPTSGALVRGTVIVFIRARDDKGLRGLVLRAKEQATSRDQSIYTGTLRGQEVEVQVRWDTTVTHPNTGEPLFPDGVYLLQAWVVNEQGQRTFSNEVLVIVQNKVAQPVLSQATPAPPPRGGATLTTATTMATTTLALPTVAMTPLIAMLNPLPTPTSRLQPQWTSPSGTRPSPRLAETMPHPLGVMPMPSVPSTLPSPQMAQGLPSFRSSLQIAEAISRPLSVMPVPSAPSTLPSPQTAQGLPSSRSSLQIAEAISRPLSVMPMPSAPSTLPSPHTAQGLPSSRSSLQIAEAISRPLSVVPVPSAPSTLPSPQTAQGLELSRSVSPVPQSPSSPPQRAPLASGVSAPLSAQPRPTMGVQTFRTDLALPKATGQVGALPVLPKPEGMKASLPEPPRFVLLTARRMAMASPSGSLASAPLPEPERILPLPELPHPAAPTPARQQVRSPKLQPLHGFRYTAIAGDTLQNLAERFGVEPEVLAAANGLSVRAPLRVGQQIWVPAPSVKVWVDDRLVKSETPAFLRDGMVIGPFRAIVEASGGVVDWDNTHKQAIATLGSLRLLATIGRKELTVNGERLVLPIAPFLLGNRTFLPLRSLGQALGKSVEWQEGTLRLRTPEQTGEK
jgi:LysM repeat protein